MTNEIQNLRDLFIEQGRELFDSSKQQQEELAMIKKEATNERLVRLVERQLQSSADQNRRINESFNQLHVSPEGEASECCEAIFVQTHNLIERSPESHVRDAAIINCIQRLNHLNITGLGSLGAYAKSIGHVEITASMHDALVVEKAIDEDLSELAEDVVNKSAVTVGGG